MSTTKDVLTRAQQKTRLIIDFSINDFKKRYSGAMFGIIWAYIQPIVTILIYWLVFEFGFKQPPMDGAPYLLWFVCGLVPWLYFSDIIQSSQGCLYEYNYLVKKVVFDVNILPLVKACVSTAINIFFIFLIFTIYGSHGYRFDLYCLQIIYYVVALIALALSISYFSSAVSVFFQDFGQIITIFLQMGMWLVPIAWPLTMVPERLHWVVKLNPFFYIVQGFRDSFIHKIAFWHHWKLTVYFWVVCLVLLFIGVKVFNKLKPHFADIL